MRRFPEQNFSVICLCNADNIDPDRLVSQVVDIFLADQFKLGAGGESETIAAPPVNIPEKELAGLTGIYVDPINEATINRFYMEDGKLMINPNFNKGPSYALSPLGQNRFKLVGAPVEIVFVRPIAGGPTQEKVIWGGKTRVTLDRVQNVPSSIQLAEFAGKYVSDELGGATYTLNIKDGNLSLQIRNGITAFSGRGQVLAVTQAFWSETPKGFLLTPEFADAFVYGDSDRRRVRFTRNQQNAISGFTLSNTVARRLRFDKR
jgi:hypothetical protein